LIVSKDFRISWLCNLLTVHIEHVSLIKVITELEDMGCEETNKVTLASF